MGGGTGRAAPGRNGSCGGDGAAEAAWRGPHGSVAPPGSSVGGGNCRLPQTFSPGSPRQPAPGRPVQGTCWRSSTSRSTQDPGWRGDDRGRPQRWTTGTHREAAEGGSAPACTERSSLHDCGQNTPSHWKIQVTLVGPRLPNWIPFCAGMCVCTQTCMRGNLCVPVNMCVHERVCTNTGVCKHVCL